MKIVIHNMQNRAFQSPLNDFLYVFLCLLTTNKIRHISSRSKRNALRHYRKNIYSCISATFATLQNLKKQSILSNLHGKKHKVLGNNKNNLKIASCDCLRPIRHHL